MAESSLFAASPHQPIDVMLLVENSPRMSSIWGDLQSRYLSVLMSRLQLASSEPTTASVTVWCLESQSASPSPRPYNDPHQAVASVQLSYGEENRISSAMVDEAVTFLESLRADDQTRSLHLVVVAASSPLLDSSDYTPWYDLAHKLGQADIHCHLLMPATSEDMTALTTLFEETLRSQSNLEDLVSFPVDPEFAVRLSMSPHPGQFNPPPRPQRIPMPPRRNTFPLETGSQFDHEQQQQYHLQLQQQQHLQQQQILAQQSAQPPDGSSNLVSRLQQVHGLTKKKVYGAKPVRKPFFKDEPYYDQSDLPHPHAAPLKAPAYSHDGTLAPSSGRAMTHSKADRMARLQHANPTDPQGRQGGTAAWARRSIGGSRLASPEITDPSLGHAPPLPTGSFSDLSSPQYLSSNLSSPVSPVSVDYGHGASIVNGGSPDPTWLQPAYPAPGYATGIPPPPHSAPPTQQGYYVSHPPAPPVHGMYHPEYAPMQVPQGMPGPGMVRSNASPPNAAMSPPPMIPPPPGAVTATSGKTITPPPRSGASSVSSAPGTSTTTTAATSTSTTPRSSKKQKPNRPEDNEFIELDPNFVRDSTDLFNEMFPNAKEQVKAAVEGRSGSGVGKVGIPAAGVGAGAAAPGTGSASSSASLTKSVGPLASGSTTTSSPASTSSSKAAGGSKSPSTATSSPKSRAKTSKRGSISKKAKRSGETASPSIPPSTVTNPATSSAPIPTSLPPASASTASKIPVSTSGLSASMTTTTTTTMSASDSGFSGNTVTGVAIGTGVPVGAGLVQESGGSQVYGIGLVGAVLDPTSAKPRVSVGHAIVQGPPGTGPTAAAVLQPLMYTSPPQGASGSALGYGGTPQQGGVQASLQPHYAHQFRQHPAQIQTHQLHQPAYLQQSPAPSPVLDNAGRYQHMGMAPPAHPSTHHMGLASGQYDDGSEVGGYYPSSHYAASLGDSMPGGGPLTPNSLAGWAGSV